MVIVLVVAAVTTAFHVVAVILSLGLVAGGLIDAPVAITCVLLCGSLVQGARVEAVMATYALAQGVVIRLRGGVTRVCRACRCFG